MRLRPRRLRTRLTVAGDTLSSAAICLPVQRCRRSASIRSITAIAVGRCKRCGRDERSFSPAMPSASSRATHLRAVRGQTPAARAAASGVCPLSTARARRSRPHGVKRAFLWTFIRSSLETEALTTSASSVRTGWTTYGKLTARSGERQVDAGLDAGGGEVQRHVAVHDLVEAAADQLRTE